MFKFSTDKKKKYPGYFKPEVNLHRMSSEKPLGGTAPMLGTQLGYR